MAQEILDKLFDSPVKVRLLRLFFRSQNNAFAVDEVSAKIQKNIQSVKKEIDSLMEIGLLVAKKGRKKPKEKKPGLYYFANPNFEFYQELRTLVLKSAPTTKEKLLHYLTKLGRIKLAIISGVFLNCDNSRVDLFLVTNKLNESKLKSFLKEIEAEVGREIEYAFMNVEEFNYRSGMFDRFLIDVLERPHEKLINKLNIE